MHAVLQQISLGINETMALATLHLLGAIVPARSAHLRGLDRLAIDDGRTRLRSPAGGAAVALAQHARDLLPRAVLTPLSIVIEDGATRWILVRQQPPLGSRAQQVEDRLNDAPQRIGLPPSGRMAAADKGREQRPFGIGEIAGVGTGIHGGAPGSLHSP